MVNVDEQTVRHRDSRLLLASAPSEPVVLSVKVACLAADVGAGNFPMIARGQTFP